MTTQDAFVAVCAVWRLCVCEHWTGRLEAVRVRSALSMTMTGVQGTSNRLSYLALRLRPKNRLYEEHGSRGARSSNARLVSIGRDVRDVLCTYTTVHRSRISLLASRSARAGSLSVSRCCSVSPRRLSVLSVPRTRDAGYNASRAPGLAPGVCNTLSPSAACLCGARFVRLILYLIFLP